MSEKKSFSPLAFLKILGPGLILAATGIGAGDLATSALTGNRLGVAVLWAVVVGVFLKFVLSEGLTRWQLATGETLLEGAVHRLGRPVYIIFFPYFILWSFFVGSALISASGVATHAIIPCFSDPTVGKIVFGILSSLTGIMLVLIGGFKLFERIMDICIAVMFLTVIITAALICRDWGAVLAGLFIPSIPLPESGGIGWTVALIGGIGGTVTMLCYGYWIREENREGEEHLRACRIDLGFAYGTTAIFGIAMVIIGSVIEVQGTGVKLMISLSAALQERLGPVGKWAFLLGAWCAVFSSLLGVWQSAPYLFADFLGLFRETRNGRNAENPSQGEVRVQVDTKSRLYRGFLFAIGIVPMLGLFVSFSQIQKLYAVLGALFMPLLAIVLLILNGRPEWVGASRNKAWETAMLVATLLLFIYFGYLELFPPAGS